MIDDQRRSRHGLDRVTGERVTNGKGKVERTLQHSRSG